MSNIFIDAQEIKFTASCGNYQLTTSTDNKSCQTLNNTFDKLVLSLTKDDNSSISIRNDLC